MRLQQGLQRPAGESQFQAALPLEMSDKPDAGPKKGFLGTLYWSRGQGPYWAGQTLQNRPLLHLRYFRNKNRPSPLLCALTEGRFGVVFGGEISVAGSRSVAGRET